MEALTINRKLQTEQVDYINKTLDGGSYVDMFEVIFPEGINTANTLEICRVINAPTFDNKVRIMKVCIEGKKVEVKCPNGDMEKFVMSTQEDNLEGIPLFNKDPLALMAIADSLYGYILKKYVRLSKPREAAAEHAE